MQIVNYNLQENLYSYLSRQLQVRAKKYQKIDVQLVCFRLEKLDMERRKQLRNAYNKHKDDQIILISNSEKIATFAWNIDCFHFLSLPINENQINNLKFKIEKLLVNRYDHQKLRIHINGGAEHIPVSKILYIKGAGDYCTLYIKNEVKGQFIAKRISILYSKIEYLPYFSKINRSSVINLNQIKRIKGNDVYFDSDPLVKVVLSKRAIQKLGKELLWIK